VPESSELIQALEVRRLIAELVIQNGLKLVEQTFGGHTLIPCVRLNSNLLSTIIGGEKCMAVLNKETVEAVRQEREDKMLDTVHKNMELKKAVGLKQKPLHLPPDRLKWMRRSNGDAT